MVKILFSTVITYFIFNEKQVNKHLMKINYLIIRYIFPIISKVGGFINISKDEILDVEELALSILEELVLKYKKNVYERYKIDENFTYEMTVELMEEIGRKRGCLVRGGEVDYTKVANIILDDFRTGKIGLITLYIALYNSI